jgi:hypothetical protein
MLFDLTKAILFREHRQGHLFLASPALLAIVNERLDKIRRESVGQTVEQGNQAQASGPSGSRSGECLDIFWFIVVRIFNKAIAHCQSTVRTVPAITIGSPAHIGLAGWAWNAGSVGNNWWKVNPEN